MLVEGAGCRRAGHRNFRVMPTQKTGCQLPSKSQANVVSRYLSSTSGTRTINLSIGSCRLLLSTAIEVKLVVRGKQTVW